MKLHRVCLRVAIMMLAALLPLRALPQTAPSTDENQELRRLVEKMQAQYNHANYTGGNIIWNPFGSLNLGAEFLYGWTMEQNGQKANAPRIQFSAKYNFIKIDPEN